MVSFREVPSDGYFRNVVKVSEFGPVEPQHDPLSLEAGIAGHVLSFLDNSELSKPELTKRLGKNKPNQSLNNLMRGILQNRMVKYIIPNKPNRHL